MSKRASSDILTSSGSRRPRLSSWSTANTGSARRSEKSSTAEVPSGTTFVCICSGRGTSSKAVGLVALQLDRRKLFLAQFVDQTNFFTTSSVLQRFDELHIVIPKTLMTKTTAPPLLTELKNSFPNSTLSGIERKYFNDSDGLDTIRRVNMLPTRTAALEAELGDKYYALASAHALIKYIETTQCAQAPTAQSLRISFLPPPEEMCHIDSVSVRELELVRSLNVDEKDANRSTLFDIINFTCTKPGQRALKWRLLQPFKRREDIEEQLNNVEELISYPEVLENLRNLLRKSTDIEKIVSGLKTVSETLSDKTTALAKRIQNLLELKYNLNLLESFETVLDTLKDSDCIYLKAIHQFLLDNRFVDITNEMNRYFIPEATLSRGILDSLNIRMQCVRPGISFTLDEYRRLYGELIRDAENACKQISATHQLPLKLSYNSTRGFHLSLSKRLLSTMNAPAEFLKLTSDKSSHHFTTEIMLQINERLEYVEAVVHEKSMIVLNKLLEYIEPFVECLYKAAEILTELDVACSLAIVASCGSGYVRPRFSDHATVVEESRHPVLTRDWEPEDHDGFQCNPIYFSEHDKMLVLSGPNNSGKTVYMKQVVLLQVLAQIGSYVPAKWAVFRPASSIIARTGHGDDLRSNCSTFMVEALRIGQMIGEVQADSLVIIDELGRGTSEEDGSAFAFAVGSYMFDSRCFVIFSTHFELVMHLEKFFPGVANYHMETATDNDGRIEFKHLLKRGTTPVTSYGVSVALQQGLSEDVGMRASEIAEKIWSDMRPLALVEVDENLFALQRRASQLRRELFFLSKARTTAVESTEELQHEIEFLENAASNFENHEDYDDRTPSPRGFEDGTPSRYLAPEQEPGGILVTPSSSRSLSSGAGSSINENSIALQGQLSHSGVTQNSRRRSSPSERSIESSGSWALSQRE